MLRVRVEEWYWVRSTIFNLEGERGAGSEGVRLKWKVTLFQVISFFMEKVVDLDYEKSVLTKMFISIE